MPMRSDLPPAVRDAIARSHGPSLIFDRARIAANAHTLREATTGYTTLFALKSLPQLRDMFDAFDVASVEEAALVAGAKIISIADPSGRAVDARAGRLIVSCETAAQIAAAPPHAELALRVSLSSAARDPAIGAIEAAGHRRSRFGVDTREALAALRAAAGDRPLGLHVHHGPITATSAERFIATARAALALADFEPRFLNLGGAWHGIADLPRTLAAVRAAVPANLELVIEPGRALVDGAGFACGRVVLARDAGDRPLRVTELSRICHLRWSPVELVVDHPGAGVSTLFVGPTCFEEDVLGDWVTEPPAVGELVILRNVNGYAASWNATFGGVPAARVQIV